MAVPGRTSQFVPAAVKHITRLCGGLMVVDVDDAAVKRYQTARLKEGSSAKTVNNETGVFLRLLGDHGDLLRLRLKRQRALNIPVRNEPGRSFTIEEQRAMLAVAKESTGAAGDGDTRRRRPAPWAGEAGRIGLCLSGAHAGALLWAPGEGTSGDSMGASGPD